MKNSKHSLLITGLALLALLFSCDDGSEKWNPTGEPQTPPDTGQENIKYADRSKEIYDLIRIHYKNGQGGLLKENVPGQANDPSYSYLWPYDGYVSGVILLTRLGYNVELPAAADNFEKYWRESANGINLGGYGSSTNGTQGGGTRFYDDNSIVGISLVETYHVTQNRVYLDRAKRIVAFLQSGQAADGALWWNEDQKDQTGVADSNKPACSNGYATQFLLQYYEVCDASEKADVLAFAKQLYQWLKANLRDTDGCYWNDMNNQGAINQTKWTYNTGVMIQNGVRLHRITGEQSYLTDAVASAQGAYDYFVKTRNGVNLAYPDHDPWFNTKLLRAYIDLQPLHAAADTYIETYIRFMNHGYKQARTATGFFYEDWTGADPKRYYSLLMQAAAVESQAAVALYKGEKK